MSTNAVADYLLEQYNTEKTALQAARREVEDLNGQIAHLRSMLKAEVAYSRKEREMFIAEQAAHNVTTKKYDELRADYNKLLADATTVAAAFTFWK